MTGEQKKDKDGYRRTTTEYDGRHPQPSVAVSKGKPATAPEKR